MPQYPEVDPLIDDWMERRRRALARGEKVLPKERPPARFRHPGAEYTLNPFRPARGYHVGPKRGRSDPITYISAKELRAMDDPRTSVASGFDASSRWWSAQNLPQRTSSWLEREGFDGVTRTVNGDGMTEADARWAVYWRARAAMAWRDSRGRQR